MRFANGVGETKVHRPEALTAVPSPFFSLILATYGRTDELHVFLDSLQLQRNRSFELIVVDQNPDDRIRAFLEHARAGSVEAIWIRQDCPNLSLARNAGLEAADGEFVGFPDDDCWYEPDTLLRIQDFVASAKEVDGIVARWVDVTPGPGDETARLSLDDWRRFRGGDASSIALFLRRSTLKSIGGFDPRFGVGRWYGAGEETDLVLRLLADGADIRVLPAARVRHAPPRLARIHSFAEWQEKRRRERGVGALYAKHRLSPFVVARGLLAPLMTGLRPRSPVSPLMGFVVGLASTLGRLEGILHWILFEGTRRN